METSDHKTTESKDDNNEAMDCVRGNEILTIGIGQAGIYLLNEFTSTIMAEHKIDKEGKFTGNWKNTNDKLIMLKNNVYFTNDRRNNRYIPRAIFLDCDKTSINDMRSSYLGSLLPEENFSSGDFSDPVLIWAKGHYTDGAEFIDIAVDIVSK